MSHKESESQAADGKAHFPFIGSRDTWNTWRSTVQTQCPEGVSHRRLG